MLPVPVARSAGEDRHDDLRPEPADHREHVDEQRVPGPETERLVGGLGEAEIVRAREELAGAVELPRREQLLRADDAELGAELRPDQVLPAFAPAEREVGRPHPHAAGQDGEELGVLVVGVGADHEDALVRPQLFQGAGQRRDAAGAGWGELAHRGAGGADPQTEATPERAPHYCER